MKTTRLTLFLGFIFLSAAAFAQDYAFKVLANKGSNEVKSGGGAWQPLRTGASLRSSDELKLSENAYIGLVHTSGKPVEVKKGGNFRVSDLEPKANSGSGVLNKYTDFILSSNSAESKKNRLSATGAVHRAVETASIRVMLPPNQHSGVYNNKAVISWDSDPATGPFVVVVSNMFEDVLDKMETPETSIEVDLGNPKFAEEDAILVEVMSKGNPRVASQQHLIKKLTKADHDRVKKSLSEIIGEVAEITALNKFILAGFYEENNLFIDAIAAYEDAIKLAPDVPSYQEAYEEFLLRHGLKN